MHYLRNMTVFVRKERGNETRHESFVTEKVAVLTGPVIGLGIKGSLAIFPTPF